MINNNLFYYHLQSYKGVGSRHQCPKCGDKHSFVYYVDANDKIVDETVGKCNHDSSCGYHLPPAEYFKLNPNARSSRITNAVPMQQATKPLCYIPYEYVERSRCTNNILFKYLSTIFNKDDLLRVANDYLIGSTKAYDIIYWQIDSNDKVRTGKIMSYKSDGHRDREKANGLNWVHSILIKQHKLPCDWQLTQCLFGEHLLKKYPDKVVAIVEAEKTAIVASLVFADYVWVACGGIGNLNNKINILKNRKVILYPDLDGYPKWTEKAKQLTFNVMVSNSLQRYDDGANPKMDIADVILNQYQHVEQTTGNKTLDYYIYNNPEIKQLISELGLEFFSEVKL